MNAATGASNTGDKVTLALLGQKMDAQDATLKEILSTLKDSAKEQHRIDTEQCVQAEKIETIDEEVKKLRSRDTLWSVGNSLGAIVAGLIALVKS